MGSGLILPRRLRYFILAVAAFLAISASDTLPFTFAQSPEVSAEWALFDQILVIGIAVGVVVFGIMFYAIIRYRERPERKGAS